MSCHGCATVFGFLKREIGCPKCGFSYCKKCLRFKSTDSKTGKEILICSRCSNLISSKMDPEEPPIITNALLKLESLENPARPPITVYKEHAREARLAQLKKGLSVEDQEIADRLDSLRKPDHDERSRPGLHRRSSEQIEEEIETRLARLKDQDPSLQASSRSSTQLNSKPETDTDLIAKFTAEVALDNQYQTGLTDAVTGIEARLTKLRGDTGTAAGGGGQSSSSSETQGQAHGKAFDEELSEEEQVAQIIERFKAEIELEEKNSEGMEVSSGSKTGSTTVTEDVNMPSDDEDLDNLCRICDEKRATLKCDECDGDLFCNKCFQELHAELGEIHKATIFKK